MLWEGEGNQAAFFLGSHLRSSRLDWPVLLLPIRQRMPVGHHDQHEHASKDGDSRVEGPSIERTSLELRFETALQDARLHGDVFIEEDELTF